MAMLGYDLRRAADIEGFVRRRCGGGLFLHWSGFLLNALLFTRPRNSVKIIPPMRARRARSTPATIKRNFVHRQPRTLCHPRVQSLNTRRSISDPIANRFSAMVVTLEGGCRVSHMHDGEPLVEGTLRIWQQIGRATGAQAISLRVMEFAPGLSPTIQNDDCDQILYLLDNANMRWR